jgi:hypothetical protein
VWRAAAIILGQQFAFFNASNLHPILLQFGDAGWQSGRQSQRGTYILVDASVACERFTVPVGRHDRHDRVTSTQNNLFYEYII